MRKDEQRKFLIGALVFGVLTVGVQLAAVQIASPTPTGGPTETVQQTQVVSNPGSVTNPLAYVAWIGLAALAVLGLRRIDLTGIVSYLAALLVWDLAATTARLGFGVEPLAAIALGGIYMLVYVWQRSWWLVTVTGLVFAVLGATFLGSNFAVVPAIVLLAAAAVYDLVSVFGSGHMQSLAEVLTETRVPLPAILVVPTRWSVFDGDLEALPVGRENTVTMGLGDIVIPATLATSVTVFWRAPAVFGVPIPALGAILGSALGVVLVMYVLVETDRALPGLPFINTGACLGFGLGVATVVIA